MRLIQRARELEEGKEDTDMADFFATMPFLELDLSFENKGGATLMKQLSPPRCVKTHLPLKLFTKHIQKHPNLRIIQTLRNPKDTLVSFFYHMHTSLGGFNGTWDQFFQLFKEEKLPFGDFFEFNTEWYQLNKDREASLVLKFEDMKNDPRGHVIKIAKFMGDNLSDAAVDKITEHSHFKVAAPKLNALMHAKTHWRPGKSSFARTGTSGGWKYYFSQEQSKIVDAKFAEYLQPLGLAFIMRA